MIDDQYDIPLDRRVVRAAAGGDQTKGIGSKMTALTFRGLLHTINGQIGVHDVACPLCGPDRRSPANRVRKVLRVWHSSSGFMTYACARCGEKGYVLDRDNPPVDARTYVHVRAELEEHNRNAAAERLSKALALWRSRKSLRARSPKPTCAVAPTAVRFLRRSAFCRRAESIRRR